MNFDPISFAMGMNAAKGSGGSSGGSSETVLFGEQTVEGFSPNEYYGGLYYKAVKPAPFMFVAGEKYFVKWDGTEYEVTAQDTSSVMAGTVAVGNLAAYGLSGNDEPFAIISAENDLNIFALDTETSHSIKIYQKTESSGGGEVKEITVKNLFVDAGEEQKEVTVVHNWGKVPDIIIAVKIGYLAGPYGLQAGVYYNQAMLDKYEDLESQFYVREGDAGESSDQTIEVSEPNGIDGSGWNYIYKVSAGIRNATATQFVIGGNMGGLVGNGSYNFIAFFGLT